MTITMTIIRSEVGVTAKMKLSNTRVPRRPARTRPRIAAAIVALALALAAALAGCGNGGGKPGSPSSTPGSGGGYGFTAPHSAVVSAQHIAQ